MAGMDITVPRDVSVESLGIVTRKRESVPATVGTQELDATLVSTIACR